MKYVNLTGKTVLRVAPLCRGGEMETIPPSGKRARRREDLPDQKDGISYIVNARVWNQLLIAGAPAREDIICNE